MLRSISTFRYKKFPDPLLDPAAAASVADGAKILRAYSSRASGDVRSLQGNPVELVRAAVGSSVAPRSAIALHGQRARRAFISGASRYTRDKPDVAPADRGSQPAPGGDSDGPGLWRPHTGAASEASPDPPVPTLQGRVVLQHRDAAMAGEVRRSASAHNVGAAVPGSAQDRSLSAVVSGSTGILCPCHAVRRRLPVASGT